MTRGRPSSVPGPARVLVCDDSAIVRAAMVRILESSSDIHVVGRTSNGRDAVRAVEQRRDTGEPVDVLVLDLEMPVMDGLTALPLLLQADPGLRVLISSTTTRPGAAAALRALRLGAADYVCKPSAAALLEGLPFELELIEKVIGLARLRRIAACGLTLVSRPVGAEGAILPGSRLPPRLVAIGSSTGGPQALFTLLAGLQDLPATIVIAQHMPPTFTSLLAENIARLGAMPCTEACQGEALSPGHAYVAPGGRHLLLARHTDKTLHAVIADDPEQHHCRPSIDFLLHSAAAACPGDTLVVMLTGMGQDGLAGTRAIVEGGGSALAQNEATSVVWGMPGAVAKAGLCRAILPLDELAQAIRKVVAA